MADLAASGSILDHRERHNVHERDLRYALSMLKARFDAEGIALAVAGAVAMQEHGFVRHTEDLDSVTTPEELAR